MGLVILHSIYVTTQTNLLSIPDYLKSNQKEISGGNRDLWEFDPDGEQDFVKKV